MASLEAAKEHSLRESLRCGEYEAQLFETASYCLLQELRELTLSDVKRTTNKLRRKLISKCESTDDIAECVSLIRLLRTKYESSVNRLFSDLEGTVYGIFGIPSHVLLPEDSTQKKQFSARALSEIDDEINALMSRYRRAVCMETILKKEKKSEIVADVIDKKTVEVEDNVKILENIFRHNVRASPFLSDELNELLDSADRIRSSYGVDDADNKDDTRRYLEKKFYLNNE